MKNQLFTGTPTSRRQVTLPEAVVGGEPVLIGGVPAFALDDWQSSVDGATVLMNGTFLWDVVGESDTSPAVGAQINPGDPLYATGGTFDADTNVTYGFTLSADDSGVRFGSLDPSPQAGGPVLSGETQNVGVLI